MKFCSSLLCAAALLALSACSSNPVLAPTVSAAPNFEAKITQFKDPMVNEAASAYVSHLKQTVEQSLQTGRYQRDLAVKYLNAESCLDSRAIRLLDKELSPQDKTGLVAAYVATEKLQAYQAIAKGHFLRPNGLEAFSCEIAGLQVDRKNLRY